MREQIGVLCRLAAAVLLIVLGGADGAFAGTRYALIVGVNEYRNLPSEASLIGPANDAGALVDYLTGTAGLGFDRENIIVLANGPIPADGVPDGQVILGEMVRLADHVRPGDFVYVHFGGHGSRQTARDPASEPDGLDEVFLPADTKPQKNGRFPNALVDDDIGSAIDNIRNAGAFVFAVFDSCHSSSATRAAGQPPSDITERWLPDATNGTALPNTAELREASIQGSEHSPLRASAGGIVTFFAAQTVETTPEMRLPRGAAGAQKRGLFSYTLLDVLARNPGITYRQLADGVMHSYSTGNFMRPTPLFEGDLDRTVFDQRKQTPVLQWPIQLAGAVAMLPAGTLHGLEKDTTLALIPDPLSDTDDALGYVRVRTAYAMSSAAVPIEYNGQPRRQLASLPANVIARPVQIPITFELTVAVQPASSSRFADAASIAVEAVRTIAQDRSLPLNLRIVDPGEEADLRLLVGSETEFYADATASDAPRLWFLPPDGRLPADRRMMPHSIDLSDGLSEDRLTQLKENFAAVFRATSLSRLASLSTLDSSDIRVGFSLRRKVTGMAEPLDASRVPVVAPGDEIDFSIENKTTAPVDVDVLLIGPNHSIQHMMGERFQARDRLDTPLIGIGASNYGMRRVLLIMREAKRNSPRSDLSFLEQIGVQTRGATSDGPRDFNEIIAEIAGAPKTRAAMSYKAGSALKGSLKIFRIESMP